MRRQKKILSEERIARRLWNVKIVNIFIIFLALEERVLQSNAGRRDLTFKNQLARKGCPRAYKDMVKLILNHTLGS